MVFSDKPVYYFGSSVGGESGKKESRVSIRLSGVPSYLISQTYTVAYDKKHKCWQLKGSGSLDPDIIKACGALCEFLNEAPPKGGYKFASPSTASVAWSTAPNPVTNLSVRMVTKSEPKQTQPVPPAKQAIEESPMRSHFTSSDAIVKHINTLLEQEYNEQAYLDCYTKVSETLLSEEWGGEKERGEDGSLVKISIDPAVHLAVKKLIVNIVEQKYRQYLGLPHYRTELKQWFADTFPENEDHYRNKERLPYFAQTACWSFIIRDTIFPFPASESPCPLRARIFNLFVDLVPRQNSGSKTSNTYHNATEYDRATISQASGKWTTEDPIYSSCRWQDGPSKLKQVHLEKTELYLLLIGKRRLKSAQNSIDQNEIPLVGCQLRLQHRPDKSAVKIDQPRTEAELMRFTADNKINPIWLESKRLVLPSRDDYQAVLTVLFPESGHLYVLPKLLTEDDTVFIKKMNTLLANEDSQKMNIVFIAIQQSSLSLLNVLNIQCSERTQFNIINPFRQLLNNQNLKPRGEKWAFQHYSMVAEDFTDVTGNFSFTFYEHGQQFHFALKPKGSSLVEKECSISPYTWSKQLMRTPNDSFMHSATIFTMNFLESMTCAISQESIMGVDTPCFDRHCHLFDKPLLLMWIRQHQTNPLTKETMTEADIWEPEILLEQIRQLRSLLLQQGIEEVPTTVPALAGVMNEKKRQLELGGDAVKQMVERNQASATKIIPEGSGSDEDFDEIDEIKKKRK
ncbi:hypothetical protein D5018_11605 [Parashewanella curva]|uniref:Uncharacterized protein n=1 Tax=Parashewanella curva TaxID=2338552 RepID=A0A3L8PYH1_9GAMM|nr:hypothetical protein [Parashewanella curva]RLV59508.1 hypothetical protein D5018_11605 [Parashewanella curva]